MKLAYDVVVVGYGPVGAVTAKLLAQGGLSVLVIDKAADIFDKPRAIGIDHEAMRVLQFCGIAHDLFPHVRTFQGSEWHSADGNVLRRFEPSSPPYSLGWPPNMTFLQPQFERMLRDSVEQCKNIDVSLQTQALHIDQDAEYVNVVLQDLKTQTHHNIQARYLVGADGASSTVRSQLGITLEDLQFDEWWIVVDMLRKGSSDYGEHNVQYCNPARPGTYVVGPGNLRRWEFRILPDESPDDFRDPQRVLQMMSESVDLSGLELWRSAVYRFHALVANQWHKGRVFLAGDAAHQTPPHLGQGLVSGLRDAFNLCWKIQHVLAGADPQIFESYMAERRPHFHSLVSKAKEFGNLIGILNPAEAQARDARLLELLAARTTPETRQNHIPPLTTGLLDLDEKGFPKGPAGELFIQPSVKVQAGVRLLDDGAHPKWQLLTVGDGPQQWLDAQTIALWKSLAGERLTIVSAIEYPAASSSGVAVYIETDNRFQEWMNKHGAQAIVVRPDRYIYGIASNQQQLIALLNSVRKKLISDSAEAFSSLKFR